MSAISHHDIPVLSGIGFLRARVTLAIADPAEAREAATDAVIALRRSGYVLSARRTEART
jgi:hypothetical protein